MKKALPVPVIAFLLFLTGCDEGLKPPASAPAASGTISGTVRFLHWDSAGTLLDLRVVAFRTFPPGDIITEVLEGRATVYPPLGAGALAVAGIDSVPYSMAVGPGTLAYIAVAQQFGPDIMSDWRAVGQYDLDTNLTVPSSVTVAAGATVTGIDITVDFDNLPPPPF